MTERKHLQNNSTFSGWGNQLIKLTNFTEMCLNQGRWEINNRNLPEDQNTDILFQNNINSAIFLNEFTLNRLI